NLIASRVRRPVSSNNYFAGERTNPL
ncbi:uncharacterized protein METZ01_LOCUS247161, partial [marine metagenome]